MPKELTYAQQRAQQLTLLTREVLSGLPDMCRDFIRAIEPTTQPLTRYAYACDLKLFFGFLFKEILTFASKDPRTLVPADLAAVSARDVSLYLEYLALYYIEDNSVTNGDDGRMRKLASLRSFYSYLFKNQCITADVSRLIDMPKRHEKPILRLEIDEIAKMLDLVESGDAMSGNQKKYNENTKMRDLAILSLFLGTGIRVSELVGIDIPDVDFNLNGFTVTRKGGSQAILYFPDEVSEVLRHYLTQRREVQALSGHENALFLSLQRRRISVRAVEVMVKKYATLASPLKKKLSPHKLRSTFGTNLYHETGDIYLVADVLGHSDVNTTRRHYAAMLDDRRRMAAKSVKLRDDPKPEKEE
jgi:site-specific recombinase XerD